MHSCCTHEFIISRSFYSKCWWVKWHTCTCYTFSLNERSEEEATNRKMVNISVCIAFHSSFRSFVFDCHPIFHWQFWRTRRRRKKIVHIVFNLFCHIVRLACHPIIPDAPSCASRVTELSYRFVVSPVTLLISTPSNGMLSKRFQLMPSQTLNYSAAQYWPISSLKLPKEPDNNKQTD